MFTNRWYIFNLNITEGTKSEFSLSIKMRQNASKVITATLKTSSKATKAKGNCKF